MSKAKRDFVQRQLHYAGDTFYIRPTFCVSIPEFVSTEPRTGKQHRLSLQNLKDNKHKGDVSAKAQQKIRNAVNWLIQAAKPKRVYDKKSNKHFYFRVNFVTLTIPAQDNCPSDNVIKAQVLHPFIVYMRKYCGLRNYVWRAEAQHNGMIHFHILTDTFLHWRRIRTTWNRLLEKNGLLDSFIAEHGHSDPNSTDVHATREIQNLGAYIAKYVAKKDESRRSITGRLWGCNYELSHENKTAANCTPDETAALLRQMETLGVKWKTLESAADSLGRRRSVGTLHLLTERFWKALRNTPIGQSYYSRIFEIRSNHVAMPIEYYTINADVCQSITLNTPVTGLPKSDHSFCAALKGSAKSVVQRTVRKVTGILQEYSSNVTNISYGGAQQIALELSG